MKILAERDALLTNFEVLQHINEVKRHNTANKELRNHSPSSFQNLDTIIIELQRYLKERPAGNEKHPQTKEGMENFLRTLHSNGIKLEKAERLQLIDLSPSSEPVLYNVIEECEQRLDPNQISLVLSLISEHLGFEPAPEAKDDD